MEHNNWAKSYAEKYNLLLKDNPLKELDKEEEKKEQIKKINLIKWLWESFCWKVLIYLPTPPFYRNAHWTIMKFKGSGIAPSHLRKYWKQNGMQ